MRENPLHQKNKKTTSGTAKSLIALPPSIASSSIPTIDPNDLITIAYITRPQGIKGEVTASIETDFPERFEDVETVFLVFPDGKIQEASLETFRFHKDRILLKFFSVDDRNQAEILRNVKVKIPSSELMTLPKEHYYEFDLIGCQVFTNTGIEVGKVEGLMHTGPAPLLIVKGAKENLIPLAEEICYQIDIESKKILVDPPEGLLEL